MNQPTHMETPPARPGMAPRGSVQPRPPADRQLRLVPPYKTGEEDIDRVVMRCRD